MRLDGLEDMHFRHIKIQADRLPDFDLDLGIHHGQETVFATFYYEENFRTNRYSFEMMHTVKNCFDNVPRENDKISWRFRFSVDMY
jgi:hypothetical protein